MYWIRKEEREMAGEYKDNQACIQTDISLKENIQRQRSRVKGQCLKSSSGKCSEKSCSISRGEGL